MAALAGDPELVVLGDASQSPLRWVVRGKSYTLELGVSTSESEEDRLSLGRAEERLLQKINVLGSVRISHADTATRRPAC